MSVKWLVLLSLATSHAQDPRKRQVLPTQIVNGPDENEPIDEDSMSIACSARGCMKRFHEEIAPFWANRGKKDPNYYTSRLYAQEPRWIYVTDNDNDYGSNEPFFITRGKKSYSMGSGKRRQWLLNKEAMMTQEDKRADAPLDDPFFAARGKKGDHDQRQI